MCLKILFYIYMLSFQNVSSIIIKFQKYDPPLIKFPALNCDKHNNHFIKNNNSGQTSK